MNVSEYARYFSPTVGVVGGVRSGLEADVGPVAHVILCLIKAYALGVEFSSPLDAMLLRSLLGDASLGHASGGDLFPWVCHRLPMKLLLINGGDTLLVFRVEVVVGGHEGVTA
jgi:hypothetical protein